MGQINVYSAMQNMRGEERLRTRSIRYSTIGDAEIMWYLCNKSNLPESSARSAILGIQQAIRYFVLNGHSIDLGDFGKYKLGLKGKAVPHKSMVKADLIKGFFLRFNPSNKIKSKLAQISFSKVNLV